MKDTDNKASVITPKPASHDLFKGSSTLLVEVRESTVVGGEERVGVREQIRLGRTFDV
jgi:hypothetical protein